MYPLKGSQDSKHKLPAAGKATPLPEHEAGHSELLQTVKQPPAPHLGLK